LDSKKGCLRNFPVACNFSAVLKPNSGCLNPLLSPSGTPKRMSQATYAVMSEMEQMKAAGLRWYAADGHVVSPAKAFWELVLW